MTVWWPRVVMVLVFCVLSAQAELTLVRDGEARAEIVVSESAQRPRMVALAALELQTYLQKMSGARLPILTAPADAPVKIYVGQSAYTDKLGVTAEGLKYGAYQTVSGENWLVLLGYDADLTPPQVWALDRSDKPRAMAAWDALTAKATASKWGLPYNNLFARLWYPPDYEKIMSEHYGEDNRFIWNPRNSTWKRATYDGPGAGTGFFSGDEGGSLNAVYALLRGLGVRWYMPGALGEVAPTAKTLIIPEMSLTTSPDFPVRSWLWYNYWRHPFEEAIWARRLGMSNGTQLLGVEGRWPHGLNHVQEREELREAHPEYSAMIGGKRMNGSPRGNLCYSSAGLEAETAAYCRFMFDTMDAPHVSLWPGDAYEACGCELCKWKEASELVWGFMNRVATELYKTHPDRLVSCGAYTSYIYPPESIEKFSPNLVVILANIGRPSFLDEAAWNRYVELVKGWNAKLAPGRFMRYANNRYGLGRGFPVIHPHGMAKDLKMLKGISLGDVCEIGLSRNTIHSPGMDHLTLYVQSQFLWNADQDLEALLDEYFRLFYGPAEQQMKEAFAFDEASYKRLGGYTHVDTAVKIRFVEMLLAARAVAGETIYGERIQVLLDEMEPLDKLRARQAAEAVAGKARDQAPTAFAAATADLESAPVYSLKEIESGAPAGMKTTFRLAWDGDDLLVDVRCEDPDMAHLMVTENVWNGDSVAILLETPSHSYYQIEVNPDGKVFDADRYGRINTKWESKATADHVERGDDFWRVTLRIPIAGHEAGSGDPNHFVVGDKPTAEAPWFFNLGRNRLRGEDRSLFVFNPTESSGYHVPDRFAKLVLR